MLDKNAHRRLKNFHEPDAFGESVFPNSLEYTFNPFICSLPLCHFCYIVAGKRVDPKGIGFVCWIQKDNLLVKAMLLGKIFHSIPMGIEKKDPMSVFYVLLGYLHQQRSFSHTGFTQH